MERGPVEASAATVPRKAGRREVRGKPRMGRPLGRGGTEQPLKDGQEQGGPRRTQRPYWEEARRLEHTHHAGQGRIQLVLPRAGRTQEEGEQVCALSQANQPLALRIQTGEPLRVGQVFLWA